MAYPVKLPGLLLLSLLSKCDCHGPSLYTARNFFPVGLSYGCLRNLRSATSICVSSMSCFLDVERDESSLLFSGVHLRHLATGKKVLLCRYVPCWSHARLGACNSTCVFLGIAYNAVYRQNRLLIESVAEDLAFTWLKTDPTVSCYCFWDCEGRQILTQLWLHSSASSNPISTQPH